MAHPFAQRIEPAHGTQVSLGAGFHRFCSSCEFLRYLPLRLTTRIMLSGSCGPSPSAILLAVVCSSLRTRNEEPRFGSSVQDLPAPPSANAMKRKAPSPSSVEMRAEYNFDYSKAVRGKYYKRLLKEGSNIVVLETDVARAFPNSAAVNEALRVVLSASKSARDPSRRPTRTRAKAARSG